jgi:hypothetical protein
MMIDRCGSAKMGVTFEDQNTVASPSVECARGQSPKAGADHQSVELPRHGALSYAESVFALHIEEVRHVEIDSDQGRSLECNW